MSFRLDRFLVPEIIIDDPESDLMRTMLIIIAMALLTIPAISQSTQISGSYGETWLAESGNKNVIEQQQSPNQGLWSWGTIPKWQVDATTTRLPDLSSLPEQRNSYSY